jgi:uncharacterized protein YdbL (DUF1318 family)
MATTSKLKLTRDQLASFLKDHEQIRQFERLFATASQLEPTTLADFILSLAMTEAKVGEALDGIESLRRDTATTDALTQAQVAQVQAQLAALAQQLEDARIAQTAALLDALRSQVEGLQLAPPPQERKRTRYGQFYDTTTQNVAVVNTAYAVTFNTTDISDGVRLRSPSTSEIEVDTEGLYNFQVSVQIDTTSGGTDLVYLWFRKNGTDIPDSACRVQIQGNNAELLQAFNLFVNMAPGDYVQFMWAADDLDAELASFAATAFAPAIPSVIMTVSNNIRGEL